MLLLDDGITPTRVMPLIPEVARLVLKLDPYDFVRSCRSASRDAIWKTFLDFDDTLKPEPLRHKAKQIHNAQFVHRRIVHPREIDLLPLECRCKRLRGLTSPPPRRAGSHLIDGIPG